MSKDTLVLLFYFNEKHFFYYFFKFQEKYWSTSWQVVCFFLRHSHFYWIIAEKKYYTVEYLVFIIFFCLWDPLTFAYYLKIINCYLICMNWITLSCWLLLVVQFKVNPIPLNVTFPHLILNLIFVDWIRLMVMMSICQNHCLHNKI